jgi:hypothetical protein
MGVYQICSNKSPGVKIGPAPEVIDFIYVYSKKLKKSFEVCSNKSPRVKIGPAPGDIYLPYMCIAKT